MKRILFGIVAVLTLSLTFGQAFEGKLTYKVEYDIKTRKFGGVEITKDQIITKMKNDGEFFDTIIVTIKNGNYIKEFNSSVENRIIYKSDLNKIYSFRNDIENESLIDANKYNALDIKFGEPKVEKLDSLKIVNGVNCNLIKLSWGKLGEEYYFYNSEIAKLDPKLFKSHNYEYFNTVVNISKSYPLEIVKSTGDFITVKMTLKSISEEKISNELFDIEKIKTQKTTFFQNKVTNWSLFTDTKVGYTVEYPEKSIPQGGKGGFMCGERTGLLDAQFTIWWSEVTDSERINFLFNDDEIFEGYDVVEKPININGFDGIYYLKTHKEKPNEYHESIVLKTKSTWYSISNSGVKDNWFEHFYNSFKLIK